MRQKTLLQFDTIWARFEAHLPLFTALFFSVTRAWSYRGTPVYFDSFEYLRWLDQATLQNWISTLSQTHQPVHSLYLAMAFALKQLFPFLNNGALFAPLTFFPAFLIVLLWPKVLQTLGVSQKTANWAGFLLTLLPLFFLASTAIVYEPFLLLLQMGALWLWIRSCQRTQLIQAVAAGGLFGLAINVFVGSIILFPAFVVYWFFQGRKIPLLAAFLFPALALPLFLDLQLFGSFSLVTQKYLSHSGDVPLPDNNILLWIARIIRNSVVQLALHASWSGLFIACLGSFAVKKLRLPQASNALLVTLFLCGLVFTQYWHAGLFGRLSMILVLPLSFLMGSVAQSRKLHAFFIAILLLPTLLHLSLALHKPLPAEERLTTLKKMCQPETCVIVTTAPQSFWYEEAGYTTFGFRVGAPELADADAFITENLQNDRIVLIDWLAQRYPYFQFDGPIWHSLSLGKTKTSVTRDLWHVWSVELIGTPNNSTPMFSQVTGKHPESREIEVIPSYSERSRFFDRHLLGYDPLYRAFWLHQPEIITNWHYAPPENRDHFSIIMR